MVQCYSIILWKKAEKNDKSFNQIAEDAFSVLEVFKNFSSEFRPNYLSAASKKEVREFDWDYNSFYSLLKSGVNKEGKEIFKDLGYSVSFFSSKEDEKSCGINLHVGAKNERLLNTLIVDLPISFDMCKVENAKIIYDLFSGLVNVFRPFWGCVSDNILSKRYRP
nr:hypothetical protein [Lachnospiraceae bacterium]